MIYVDSSAFVRLYLQEPLAAQTRSFLASNAIKVGMACVEMGYIEVRAALGAAKRAGRLTDTTLVLAKKQFETLWQNCDQLPANADLLSRAADLSEFGSLRAYDAIHLAAAERIKQAGYPQLQFLSFDMALVRAAKMLGISCVEFFDA